MKLSLPKDVASTTAFGGHGDSVRTHASPPGYPRQNFVAIRAAALPGQHLLDLHDWLRRDYISGRNDFPLFLRDSGKPLTLRWNTQATLFAHRHPRSPRAERRIGFLEFLKKLMYGESVRVVSMNHRTELHLMNLGSRPLPLPQAIRRGDRMAHEARTMSDERGGDDA